MKLMPPAHTTQIHLSTGRIIAVFDGEAFTPPEDLTANEREQLFQAGCLPAVETLPEAPDAIDHAGFADPVE
jgi:hypothetical protein